MPIQCIRTVQIATLLSFGVLTPGYSATEVECLYDTNSEWPLPAGKVCQIHTAPKPLLLSDDTSILRWPGCEHSNSDPDCDGWGWENSSTCRAFTTTAAPVTTGTAGAQFNTCLSAASDPDGDGWGWENSTTCKVATSIATPVIAEANEAQFNTCTSTASDPDGDGWGWENSTTCQVATSPATPVITAPANTQFNTCVNATSDPDGDGWGWENSSTCKVATGNTVVDTPGTTGSSNETEQSDYKDVTGPQSPVIYQQDFEAASVGRYTPEALNTQWDTPLWHLGIKEGRVNVVNDPQKGKALRVTYPANQYGARGASLFLSDLSFGSGLEVHYEELYLSYDMKFADGFDFVRGGKLPGFCGYSKNQKHSDGCNTGGGYPTGYDGWSARGMWREGGYLESYVYNASQRNYYGDQEYWNVKAVPGQWHRVQHRIVLNTVGQRNGILEAWFDGIKVLSENTVEYRKTDDIKVNLFYFSTFYGGNDASWAPTTDQYMYFDNFSISTQPIVKSVNIAAALQQDDSVSKVVSASGGGAFFTPFIGLLVLLRRRQYPGEH